MSRTAARLTIGLVLLAAVPAWGAVRIELDYTYDGGFFTTAPEAAVARQSLELAAQTYSRLMDSLGPIIPGERHWEASIFEPDTGLLLSIPDVVVPADTLVVYAGGRGMGLNTLAVGGHGGYSFSDEDAQDPAWVDTVGLRGQDGAALDPATDAGPWGGHLSFNSAVTWNFQPTVGPEAGQYDFYTTAMHELGHVLGFGSGDSWFTYVSDTNFVGPKAEASYGGEVPLNGTQTHWANGTLSTEGALARETVMQASLPTGDRRVFTALDFAALADIGWQVAGAGDTNGDGGVNGDDFVALAINYTGSGAPPGGWSAWFQGDFDADGDVDGDDFVTLAVNYNGTLAAVPEPGSLFLLGLSGLAVWRRPRR